MTHRWSRCCIVAATLALPAGPAAAQADRVADFYTGKQLKIIVGLPPGGGADAYARLVQRHLGRHIAGTPTIVVQNMPGAGSLRSVMALNASRPDGTIMAHFSSALLMEAITAPDRVKVDFRDLCLDRQCQRGRARLLSAERERSAELGRDARPSGGDFRRYRGRHCRQRRHRHAAQPVRRAAQDRAGLCRQRRQAACDRAR